MDTSINNLSNNKPMQLDETQLRAVEHAATNRFAIITGGAGTGKTTIIKAIYERLKASSGAPMMCAFAGKAAARLKEATGHEASTIHRMLGYNGAMFMLDSLRGRSVIVDEASMVDSELMAAIVERKPDRLILVGDEAQLPPVGKGQPFHDIIALCPDRVVKLTTCYRNSEAVFRAATAIRNGEQVSDFEETPGERWRIVETGDNEKTHAAILKQVRAGFFDFTQDIILCPKNGDSGMAATVEALNADIAQIVLPREAHETFVVGDRVMNTKNNAEKDIWNGTTGSVDRVHQDGSIWIKLDEPIIDWVNTKAGDVSYKDLVMLTKTEAKSLKLAYAMTVHKSQGSQYRRVVVVCLARDSRALLSRPLIYTAVTRTKEQCIVVGQKYAFRTGCERTTNKATVIQQLAFLAMEGGAE